MKRRASVRHAKMRIALAIAEKLSQRGIKNQDCEVLAASAFEDVPFVRVSLKVRVVDPALEGGEFWETVEFDVGCTEVCG